MTKDRVSDTSSLSTVKDESFVGDQTIGEDKLAVLSHEISTGSLVKHPKIKLEPSRFPSLTFISSTNPDRETSIKNANLKSELIENDIKQNKKSKESLFGSIQGAATGSTAVNTLNSNNVPILNLNNLQSGFSYVKKAGSSTTLQTVYTDAYSNIDPYEGRSYTVAESPILSQTDFDDSCSAYQQSINSTYLDAVHPQKSRNMAYNQQNKEDTESFLYSDMNSVDLMSINDHKGQRKISNNVVFLNNPFSKENNPLLSASHNSELDFLDNKSISTVVTNNEGNHFNGSKSPVNKRYAFQQNLSISPTHHSKVRQVSQKLFHNNSNHFGSSNYSRINLQKRNHTYNEYRDSPEEIYEDNDEDVNEHTGLTDAESFLVQPFKHKRKRYKYPSLDNINMNMNHAYFKKGYNSIQDEFYDPVEDLGNENFMSNSSPHDYKSMYYKQNYLLNFLITSIYVFVLLLLLVSFLKIVVIENFDNALSKFEVKTLENVLISDEILLLDIKSQAINFNFQDVEVWDMDLDVFLVTDESNLSLKSESVNGNDITILLGNSNRFLTPFHFSGLLHIAKWKDVWDSWRHTELINPAESTSQLKIYKPGQHFEYQGHRLSREQWTIILNKPFRIILRGNLKYSLPLLWQDQFISLSTDIDITPDKN